MGRWKKQEENGIVIFPNKRKFKKSHPDWSGQLTMPDGEIWDIALWKLQGTNGIYFGGRIGNRKENREKYGKNNTDEQKPMVDDLDDLPF